MTVESTGQALFKAYKKVRAISAEEYPLENTDQAYAVQDVVVSLREADGELVQGYKIGLAAQALQAKYDTDQPIYGVMTNKTVKTSISLSDYIAPALEFEVIFIADEDINGDDEVETIMAKCHVAPGFELPDGRYHNWFGGIPLTAFVADAGAVGAVCIGEPTKASYADIDGIYGKVTFNGEGYKEGTTDKVLGHPANTVKWLAKTLEARGRKLSAGQFVASGSVNTPSPIEVGEYIGSFEGIGTVSLKVTL
jgi:2-oxo-hept-3-ene-1,7-dioate hydratase